MDSGYRRWLAQTDPIAQTRLMDYQLCTTVRGLRFSPNELKVSSLQDNEHGMPQTKYKYHFFSSLLKKKRTKEACKAQTSLQESS
jgi:hypothetical protein